MRFLSVCFRREEAAGESDGISPNPEGLEESAGRRGHSPFGADGRHSRQLAVSSSVGTPETPNCSSR